ncbi:hypothetical protein J6590_015763 [Homalodisca vitripennis]|nr:hypothetical protein J6590_015763 [Homalodisca vitripennis]
MEEFTPKLPAAARKPEPDRLHSDMSYNPGQPRTDGPVTSCRRLPELSELVPYSACYKKLYVRSGIRTHAHRSGLRPERSALDHSAILTDVEMSRNTRI